MEEKNKIVTEDTEKVEYEDVKRLSLGGFIGIGFAFGVAAGFSAVPHAQSETTIAVSERIYMIHFFMRNPPKQEIRR